MNICLRMYRWFFRHCKKILENSDRYVSIPRWLAARKSFARGANTKSICLHCFGPQSKNTTWPSEALEDGSMSSVRRTPRPTEYVMNWNGSSQSTPKPTKIDVGNAACCPVASHNRVYSGELQYEPMVTSLRASLRLSRHAGSWAHR
jgi:hypothetical protein